MSVSCFISFISLSLSDVLRCNLFITFFGTLLYWWQPWSWCVYVEHTMHIWNEWPSMADDGRTSTTAGTDIFELCLAVRTGPMPRFCIVWHSKMSLLVSSSSSWSWLFIRPVRSPPSAPSEHHITLVHQGSFHRPLWPHYFRLIDQLEDLHKNSTHFRAARALFVPNSPVFLSTPDPWGLTWTSSSTSTDSTFSYIDWYRSYSALPYNAIICTASHHFGLNFLNLSVPYCSLLHHVCMYVISFQFMFLRP